MIGRLSTEIGLLATPLITSNASLLLHRLLPLAERLHAVRPDFWPFCEAIDKEGRLVFFPKDVDAEFSRFGRARKLDACLRYDVSRKTFRSIGVVSPIQTSAETGFCIELLLGGTLAVTIFSVVGTGTLMLTHWSLGDIPDADVFRA